MELFFFYLASLSLKLCEATTSSGRKERQNTEKSCLRVQIWGKKLPLPLLEKAFHTFIYIKFIYCLHCPVLAQVSRRRQSACGWTLVDAGLFLWPRQTPRPGGGERGSPTHRPDPSEPDSCGAESQRGCRAGEWADSQGEQRPGAAVGPAGWLPGQAERAGGRSGATASSVAGRMCPQVDLNSKLQLHFMTDTFMVPLLIYRTSTEIKVA